MNTHMKEINLNEMEAVNGGSVIAAIGLGTACVTLAVSVAEFAKKIYKDVTSD